MKKFNLILIAIFIYSNGIACTIIPDTFCKTFEWTQGNLIVSGEIVSVDNLGIDLEIIEVLKGEESREIIRIWNGTDFECNGIWTMAASTIGELNDSVVIILPMITEINNDWDVIGDFYRPDPYDNTPELKFEDGFVKGLIHGDAIAPPEFNLLSLDYDSFKEDIIEKGDCSDIVLNTDNLNTESSVKINNPFTYSLSIQLDEVANKGFVKLYSLNGEVVLIQDISNQKGLELETSRLKSGMYFLEIRVEGKLLDLIKVVKL